MVFEAAKFKFEAPPAISRARRVLIKPSAAYPVSYPVTTSREMLAVIIDGIRKVSDADILILEGTMGGDPVYPIYQTLGYDFPRVLTLDVRDCICVEVDNPLVKPLAIPTFWVPNVILSSDYLITVAPPKVISNRGSLSIMNLLSLLPSSKYQGEMPGGWGELYSLGIERVAADLYFTLPFDLGIVEARQKLVSRDDPTEGKIEEYGKVFIGEPYEVDCEAAAALGIRSEYLSLIKEAKVEFEA
ncbi:hypothetical protein ACFLS8_05785 [Chloroflexota bacterium]